MISHNAVAASRWAESAVSIATALVEYCETSSGQGVRQPGEQMPVGEFERRGDRVNI
jgi:hypothetical protein